MLLWFKDERGEESLPELSVLGCSTVRVLQQRVRSVWWKRVRRLARGRSSLLQRRSQECRGVLQQLHGDRVPGAIVAPVSRSSGDPGRVEELDGAAAETERAPGP